MSTTPILWQTRLARQTDLGEIVEIYNSTIASRLVTADTEPITVESRQAWFLAHQSVNRPLWVVENPQGMVIAWLSFSDFYGRPAYSITSELSIYIHPDFRGQGLGRFLLNQAIAKAPSLGIRKLLGFIFGQNVASLALFQALGFSTWGQLPDVAVLDGLPCHLLIVGRDVC